MVRHRGAQLFVAFWYFYRLIHHGLLNWHVPSQTDLLSSAEQSHYYHQHHTAFPSIICATRAHIVSSPAGINCDV